MRATFRTQACDALFPELYERFASAKVWRVFDDVRPALVKLKAQEMKLGVISNWDERLRPLLDQLELTPFFDVIVVSSEIGYCKPAPEIFRETLRLLKVPTGQVLHVGDSEAEDVVGASSAGMQAVIGQTSQFPFNE